MPLPTRATPTAAILSLLLCACEYRPADGHGAREDSADVAAAAPRVDSAGGDVDVDVSVPIDTAAANDVAAPPEALADTGWRFVAEADRARRHPSGAPAAPLPALGDGADTASLAALTPARVNARTTRPALGGEGATVLRAQILLDQAGFSPGALDGRWGANASRAVYWFQDAQGLPVSGFVDAATFARLDASVGDRPAVTEYTVTARDVAGPFERLAASPYDRARQRCLCYESAWEGLAERFHATRELLARLNPGLDTTRIAEGTRLWVPNVERTGAAASAPAARGPSAVATPGDSAVAAGGAAAGGTVARVIVSRGGGYLHALDAAGRVLFHAPTTVGTRFGDATPDSGALRVTRVVRNPSFHYDPRLYADVADSRPDARLPAGPNSPVGVAWIALSKPHFGIHGTESPATIGHASSHGCVRLTNWDVAWLADHVPVGTLVELTP